MEDEGRSGEWDGVGKGRKGEERKEGEGRAKRGHPWFLLIPPDMKSWIKH